MTPTEIAIGAGVTLLVIVLVYYVYSSSSKSSSASSTGSATTTLSGSTPAPGTAATPTYTLSQGVIGANYGNCTGTAANGYCILPMQQAINLCNSDPNCTGYGQGVGNSVWMGSYGSDYQLFNGATSSNLEWNTYVKNSS